MKTPERIVKTKTARFIQKPGPKLVYSQTPRWRILARTSKYSAMLMTSNMTVTRDPTRLNSAAVKRIPVRLLKLSTNAKKTNPVATGLITRPLVQDGATLTVTPFPPFNCTKYARPVSRHVQGPYGVVVEQYPHIPNRRALIVVPVSPVLALKNCTRTMSKLVM